MFSKKGISVLKYVYIITLIGILFILFIIVFFNLTSITLNEKSLQHQLIMNSIIKKCSIPNTIATFNTSKLSKEYFSSCINNDNETYTSRITIYDLKNKSSPLKIKSVEIGKNNFIREQQFCSIFSTKHCSEIKHRILLVENNSKINGLLTVQIIS